MSLDRFQSKQGNLVLNAEPAFTVNSSLSSIGSNQLPGGYIFGSNFALLAASTGSGGGGAVMVRPSPTVQTFAVSSGTGAYITHDNTPAVFCSLSTGGLHNLQPANFHGQMLTVVNYNTQSCSLVTGAIISGQGAGSTTTAVVPTLAVATTVAAQGFRVLIAHSTAGATATNSTQNLWYPCG